MHCGKCKCLLIKDIEICFLDFYLFFPSENQQSQVTTHKNNSWYHSFKIVLKTDLWSFFSSKVKWDEKDPTRRRVLMVVVERVCNLIPKRNHKYQFSDNLHLQNPYILTCVNMDSCYYHLLRTIYIIIRKILTKEKTSSAYLSNWQKDS